MLILKLFWQRILVICLLFICNTFIYSEDGICYQWSEGDALHLNSCSVSTLESCSKGKKSIQKKDTAFQIYKGKLFKDNENNIYEFRKESKDECDKELIKSAREAELAMCSNWGKAVYASNLKIGDTAYIYGKSVNLRENPNTKAKKIAAPEDRTEVKILERSSKEDSIQNLYSAYWFKISVKGTIGWVYGQFLHPNPNSKEEFIQ